MSEEVCNSIDKGDACKRTHVWSEVAEGVLCKMELGVASRMQILGDSQRGQALVATSAYHSEQISFLHQENKLKFIYIYPANLNESIVFYSVLIQHSQY